MSPSYDGGMTATDSAAPATETPATTATPPTTPPTAPSAPPADRSPADPALAATVDVAALGEQLLGRWADARRASREYAKDPRLTRVPGESLREHRDRVLEALHYLSAQGVAGKDYPERLGGTRAAGDNVAGFEEMALCDPSVGIKGGVQWGLFGAAVLHLGTERHQDRWLPGIRDMTIPGAFAMTETGHGSDVASIATTATYDPATEEFVIHTPFRAAWKDYLGNAAEHGVAATLFAQLITNGENHGVHCFYVPIRDPETMAFLPGVGGEDDGVKGGLNGVDNGRLHFDHVRIPRDNLLDRYGSVAPDGTYSSPIASKGRRFFTMLGTLVQGRVSLDGSATVAAKLGLTIAIKYGDVRRQFSPNATAPETVLLDYGRHQRRLLPRLAQVYAMSFAHEGLLQRFDDVFSGRDDTDANRQDLETYAAALKALSTWGCLDILQEAREACGGQGFMADNRIAPLRADMDVWVTFEGDNNVLLQLVGKRLLTDYSKRMSKPDAAVIRRYVADQIEEAVLERTGLRALGQDIVDFGSNARRIGYIRDTDSQRQLLTDRVETMIADVAEHLKDAKKLEPAAAAALFNRHQNDLILAARAHGELLQWEAFTEALDAAAPENRQVLTWLRDLFGLGLIEANIGWYLMNGKISGARAKAITEYIDGRLLPRLRRHAVALVDAFLIPDELIGAPIATGAEAARQQEAMAHRA